MTSAIPQDLRQSIERHTGAAIVDVRPRGGGGASRQGAELRLRSADGAAQRCYLAWDSRVSDPARLAYFQRETAVLAALSGPLAGAGVRVAPLVAAEPSHLALCSAFVEGDDRFAAAADKTAVAQSFIEQLARLHALDAAHPAFAALGDPAEPPSAVIRKRLDQLSADNLASGADPVLQLALQWLAANIPEDRGPAVVVHGDAGPGNFLFEGDRVVALVDWELTHLGDPIEDIAQIWVRSLIQPFVPISEVFAAYEAASGTSIDLARVKYHRLYFQLGFSVAANVTQAAQGGTPGGSTGTAMLFGTMHRRVIVEALAELAQVPLAAVELPDCPVGRLDAGFAAALDDIKDEILPSVSDERAAAKAKALARIIKFWRMRDRCGAVFDAAELGEINAALASSETELLRARAALGHAIAADDLPFGAALALCHARTVRETHVMKDAMGALATTRYEDRP